MTSRLCRLSNLQTAGGSGIRARKTSTGDVQARASSELADRDPVIRFNASTDYVRFIGQCARRRMSETPYSGEYLKSLASFLKRELHELDKHGAAGQADVHLYYFSETRSPIYQKIASTKDIDTLEHYFHYDDTDHSSNAPSSAILSIRGHQILQSLNKLGVKFNIDQHIYQRHLDYRWTVGPSQLLTMLVLASSALNMLKLHICSIGEFGDHGQSVSSLRAKAETAMKEYNYALVLEHDLSTI